MIEIFLDSLLIRFDRFSWERPEYQEPADIAEAIGSILLHPLKSSLGVTYIQDLDKNYLQVETDPMIRCGLIIVAVVSVPFALIGVLFLQSSASYQRALSHLLMRSNLVRQLSIWGDENFNATASIFRHTVRWLTNREITHYLHHMFLADGALRFGHFSDFVGRTFMRALEESPEKLPELMDSFSYWEVGILTASCQSAEQLGRVADAVCSNPKKMKAVILSSLSMLSDPRADDWSRAVFLNGLQNIAGKLGQEALIGHINKRNRAQLEQLQQMEGCPLILMAAQAAIEDLNKNPPPPPPFFINPYFIPSGTNSPEDDLPA